MSNVDWLLTVLSSLVGSLPPQEQHEEFQEREAELKRRLSHLQHEVEVIQRTQSREDAS